MTGSRKKVVGWNGDRLRRDALKRANSAVCGRVISCSRGQGRWRTELELRRLSDRSRIIRKIDNVFLGKGSAGIQYANLS